MWPEMQRSELKSREHPAPGHPFLDTTNPLARRNLPETGRSGNKSPVEEEGLLEGAAEAGLLVPEPRAGVAVLAGAVDASAPVEVPAVAVPLVDVPPGPEPEAGERVGEGEDAYEGDRRHCREERPL
jgi:hypothetical protein